MRLAVWFRELGQPLTPFPADGTPYEAKSPTLRQRVTYTTEEIWREVARIDEQRGTARTLGQELFFLCGFFAAPDVFLDPACDEVLDDYRMSAALGVPLAQTLDRLPAYRSEYFVAIGEELAAVRRYMAASRKG